MKTVLGACLTILIFATIARAHVNFATFDGANWNVQVAHVTEAPIMGSRSISLAMDSSDRPHISFYEHTHGGYPLQYVTHDGLDWVTTTVDDNASINELGTSIKLTSVGDPRISYARTGHNSEELRYASQVGAAWSTELVDGSPRVGHFNSLVLDSFDQPHISYWDSTNSDLKLATNTGIWSTETIDSAGSVGISTSIAFFDGKEQIAYRATGLLKSLKFARRSGGWEISTVDAGIEVGGISLALDPAGNPEIVYVETSPGSGDVRLKHAAWNPLGSNWSISEVTSGVDTGISPSIVISSDGITHISYTEYFGIGSARLWHGTRQHSGEWFLAAVDEGKSLSTKSSIAIDSVGRPVIAYTMNPVPIPEPSTLALFAISGAAIGCRRPR